MLHWNQVQNTVVLWTYCQRFMETYYFVLTATLWPNTRKLAFFGVRCVAQDGLLERDQGPRGWTNQRNLDVFFFLIFGHFGWNYAPGYCLDGQTCKQRGTHTHKCKWNQIEKTWNTSLSWFSNGTWTTYIVAYDFWNAHLLAISFRVPTPSFLAPVNTPLGWHRLAKPGSLILCCQCVKIGWTTRIGKIM